MSERRPHLLAVEHPLVAVALGARLHVGEIGAGIGFGVALAPDLRAVEDAGEESLFLRVGREVHDRRTEQSFADDADPARTAGARVLLVEDHLLHEGGAPTAVFGGPAEADPVRPAQLLFPLPALIEQLVLVAGAAAAAHHRVGAFEAFRQPGARVGPEPLLDGCEAQVHRETWHAIARVRTQRSHGWRSEEAIVTMENGLAVVTGASRGIGRAVAIELAARGFDTIATMRDVTAGQGLGAVRVEHLDVTDPATINLPDGLRVLVNNAGVESENLPLEKMPADMWRRLFETNVFGLIEVTKRAVPLMPRGRWGSDLQHHVVVGARAGAVPRCVPGVEGRGHCPGRVARSRGGAVRHSGRRDHARSDRNRNARGVGSSRAGDRARRISPRSQNGCGKGARAFATSYTPAPEAARRIVDAICDDDGPLRYGCDDLSEGMLTGWNTTDNARWVSGMLRSFS